VQGECNERARAATVSSFSAPSECWAQRAEQHQLPTASLPCCPQQQLAALDSAADTLIIPEQQGEGRAAQLVPCWSGLSFSVSPGIPQPLSVVLLLSPTSLQKLLKSGVLCGRATG
jgi:hypothetical protein